MWLVNFQFYLLLISYIFYCDNNYIEERSKDKNKTKIKNKFLNGLCLNYNKKLKVQ